MNVRGRRRSIPLLLLVGSLLLVSCAAPSYTEGAATLAPLILRVGVDHAKQPCLKGGDTLDVRFTVTNEDQQPFVAERKDEPVLDIVLVDSPSMETVSSWASQNPDQVQHRVEWQPGETKTLDLKWIIPQKEYLQQQLDVAGRVYMENPKIGHYALVTLCLGKQLHK